MPRMPCRTSPQRITHETRLVRLRIEAAKARQIEADAPATKTKNYMRYAEMKPLHPHDRPLIDARFRKLFCTRHAVAAYVPGYAPEDGYDPLIFYSWAMACLNKLLIARDEEVWAQLGLTVEMEEMAQWYDQEATRKDVFDMD